MINFPAPAIPGQEFDFGDTKWVYDGEKWTIADKALNQFAIPKNGIQGGADLPQYDNNGDAVLGGLAVDDLYKTSTGEIRVVV